MIAAGWRHALAGPFEGMVYTAMQEAATRTFYLCAARACGDEHPSLGAALRRIAKAETLHMAFYRDVVKVHLETDPDYLRPLAAVMLGFEMPWSASVLRDFEERRAYLAACGVFRLADYLDEVVSRWVIPADAASQSERRGRRTRRRRYRGVAQIRPSGRRPAGTRNPGSQRARGMT
jgi:acyl-[acyl-carrier-protein] desaturase